MFWKFQEVFFLNPHDRNIGSSLEHNMEDSTIWSLPSSPKRCRKVFPDCPLFLSLVWGAPIYQVLIVHIVGGSYLIIIEYYGLEIIKMDNYQIINQ